MTQEKAVPVVELKACPFCGKPPSVQEKKGIFSATVGCDCAAAPCVLSRDIALAKALWNTRADEQQAAIIAELREALGQIRSGSRLGQRLFADCMASHKDRPTWHAVNVLQDNLAACEATAAAAIGS